MSLAINGEVGTDWAFFELINWGHQLFTLHSQRNQAASEFANWGHVQFNTFPQFCSTTNRSKRTPLDLKNAKKAVGFKFQRSKFRTYAWFKDLNVNATIFLIKKLPEVLRILLFPRTYSRSIIFGCRQRNQLTSAAKWGWSEKFSKKHHHLKVLPSKEW